MGISESDRLKTKLHALHMRLAELDAELQRTRIEEKQLESRLENARLASMFGEGNGDVEELRPQLEAVRHRLEDQLEVITRVRDSQRITRVHYLLLRQQELRERKQSSDS